MGVEAASDAYFGRRAQTGRIQAVMNDLVSGSSATGVMGTGVSGREASNMMQQMRMSAAVDPTKSMDDYMNILETGAATGLYNFSDNTTDVMANVKQASKMVNMMMMLAEDPDIQSSIKRMADFQAMGIAPGQMERMATDLRGFASLANASFEEVMNRGGSIGAQQMQMMGGSAAFGMRAGGMAMGAANRMMQSGFFSPEEAAMRGGRSGITQQLSGMLTNNIHSYLSTRAAAFMNPDGSLNQEAFRNVVEGRGDAINSAIGNFSNMSSADYIMNYQDAVASGQASLSSMDTINMMRQMVRERQDLGLSRNEALVSIGGEQGARVLERFISDDNVRDVNMAELRTLEETSSKRRAELSQASKFYNRIGTGIASDMERFTQLAFGGAFDSIAEYQEQSAAEAAGAFYRPGIADTSGLSESARRRFSLSSKLDGADSGLTFRSIEGRDGIDAFLPNFFDRTSNRDMAELFDEASGGVEAFKASMTTLDRSVRKFSKMTAKEKAQLRVTAQEEERIANVMSASEDFGGDIDVTKLTAQLEEEGIPFEKVLKVVTERGSAKQKEQVRQIAMAGAKERMANIREVLEENKEDATNLSRNLGSKSSAIAAVNLSSMQVLDEDNIVREISNEDIAALLEGKKLDELGLRAMDKEQGLEITKNIETLKQGTKLGGRKKVAEFLRGNNDQLQGAAEFFGIQGQAKEQEAELLSRFAEIERFDVFATQEELEKRESAIKELSNLTGKTKQEIEKQISKSQSELLSQDSSSADVKQVEILEAIYKVLAGTDSSKKGQNAVIITRNRN
jgi:hypothetical protein